MKNTNSIFEESGYIQHVLKNAKAGHAWAQKAMGDIFYFGISMEEDLYNLEDKERSEKIMKNNKEAFEWYHNAAEQDEPSAMHAVGNLYCFMLVTGVKNEKESYQQAMKWYRKAADTGDAESLHSLAIMYENGWGVKKDLREAEKLYEKAIFSRLHKESIYPWARLCLNPDNDKPFGDVLHMLVVANYLDANAIAAKHAIQHHNLWAKVSPFERKEIRDAAYHDIWRNWEAATEKAVLSDIGLKTAIVDPSEPLPAEEIYNRIWRSVVSIETEEGGGSGVIIQPHIVATNWHVVRGAREIEIFQPKDPLGMKNIPYPVSGHPVRASNKADYCLLHVPLLPGAGIPAAIRQHETLNIGETVYALGTPGDEVLSLSKGIISQLRDDPIDGPVIQMDADIAPGSSGGGLFDSAGNLIGHPTRGHPDSDERGKWPTYAIAADIILKFDEDLRKANEEEDNGKGKE